MVDTLTYRKDPLKHENGTYSFGDVLEAFRIGYTQRNLALGQYSASLNDAAMGRMMVMTTGNYTSLKQNRILPRDAWLTDEIAGLAVGLDLTTGEIKLLLDSYVNDHTRRFVDSTSEFFSEGEAQNFNARVESVRQGIRLPEVEDESLRNVLQRLKDNKREQVVAGELGPRRKSASPIK